MKHLTKKKCKMPLPNEMSKIVCINFIFNLVYNTLMNKQNLQKVVTSFITPTAAAEVNRQVLN